MAYDHDNHQATCLECGDEIGYGRSDRKFCSQSCKNRYNNRRARTSRKFKEMVLGTLERNHEVLTTFLKLDIQDADMKELEDLGFNPKYFTSLERRGTRSRYGCFDLEYTVSGHRLVSIARAPEATVEKKE